MHKVEDKIINSGCGGDGDGAGVPRPAAASERSR